MNERMQCGLTRPFASRCEGGGCDDILLPRRGVVACFPMILPRLIRSCSRSRLEFRRSCLLFPCVNVGLSVPLPAPLALPFSSFSSLVDGTSGDRELPLLTGDDPETVALPLPLAPPLLCCRWGELCSRSCHSCWDSGDGGSCGCCSCPMCSTCCSFLDESRLPLLNSENDGMAVKSWSSG